MANIIDVTIKMPVVNEHGKHLFMVSYGEFDESGLSNAVYVYAHSEKDAMDVVASISKEMNYMADMSKCSIASEG